MPGMIANIRIDLEGTDRPIWRRVQVPLETNLRSLHFLIQDAMPWDASHLYDFMVDGKNYGDVPMDSSLPFQPLDAGTVDLANLVERKIKMFHYEYDYMAGWMHRIRIESVSDAEKGVKYPRLLGGERKAPPDDMYGPGSFRHLLKVMSNPKHPEYRDKVDWLGGPFDPEEFDADSIGEAISEKKAEKRGNLYDGDYA